MERHNRLKAELGAGNSPTYPIHLHRRFQHPDMVKTHGTLQRKSPGLPDTIVAVEGTSPLARHAERHQVYRSPGDLLCHSHDQNSGKTEKTDSIKGPVEQGKLS